MDITDEMVERAFSALYPMVEAHPDMTPDQYQRHCYGLARAALTAALGDVEPLESVLPVGIAIHLFPIHNEDNTLHEIEWEITVTGEGYGFSGSSQTIAEIVQAAAGVAKRRHTD